MCFDPCRAENTHRGEGAVHQADMNLLYWSRDECVCDACEVVGACEVVCGEDLSGDLDEWFMGGVNRFYFYQEYDSGGQEFKDPPHEARGRVDKGKVRS